jgi:hypothetical protein
MRGLSLIILVILAHIFSLGYGIVVPMQLVFIIRQVIATGTVLPRSVGDMVLYLAGMFVVGVLLYISGHLVTGCLAFAINVIPGLIVGLKEDPYD